MKAIIRMIDLAKLEYPDWVDFKNITYFAIAAIGTVLSKILTISGIEPSFVYILWVCMIIDTIAGYARAKKLKVASSSVATYGILAKLLCSIIPILVGLVVSLMGVNFGIIVKTSFIIMALHEIYSTIGSVYTIRTGIILIEQDSVSEMLLYMRSKISVLFDKLKSAKNQDIEKILKDKEDNQDQIPPQL